MTCCDKKMEWFQFTNKLRSGWIQNEAEYSTQFEVIMDIRSTLQISTPSASKYFYTRIMLIAVGVQLSNPAKYWIPPFARGLLYIALINIAEQLLLLCHTDCHIASIYSITNAIARCSPQETLWVQQQTERGYIHGSFPKTNAIEMCSSRIWKDDQDHHNIASH